MGYRVWIYIYICCAFMTRILSLPVVVLDAKGVVCRDLGFKAEILCFYSFPLSPKPEISNH